MITLKSPHEIELMRRAGKITAAARAYAGELVKPGVTTHEIDRAVEHFIRKQGAVPVESSDIRAYIAADDIALFQHPGSRDAVDDLVVDTDTDAGRIALIMEEGWNRTLLADEMLHCPVDLLGCYAGLYQFPCISTGSRGNFSRSAHQFDLMCGFERNHKLISSGR